MDGKRQDHSPNSESGNVIFFILLAIVLIGLVTVALRSGGDGNNIDRERVVIRASEVRQYASELERGVAFIMQDGASESEIRFASSATDVYGDISDTPTRQVFSENGGGVSYRLPPPDISSAPHWEFYGHTHLPDVVTAAPELIAVLPLVTLEFCQKINAINSYNSATQPLDNTGDCLNAGVANRFKTGNLYSTDAGIDTVNEATFTVKPSMEGCVQCAGNYHFFHVLMAR